MNTLNQMNAPCDESMEDDDDMSDEPTSHLFQCTWSESFADIGQSDNGSPYWGVCFAASWLSERIDWQSSKSFMAQKFFVLLAERLHVLNFAHAKPYNTSLPNHHSCCFVG